VLHRDIVKAESVDGIPSVSDRDLQCRRATLENADIEFIDMVGLKLRRLSSMPARNVVKFPDARPAIKCPCSSCNRGEGYEKDIIRSDLRPDGRVAWAGQSLLQFWF
jgi:hypothetical protein